MLAVEIVGLGLMGLGIVLLAGRLLPTQSDFQVPGVTIKAPASVLILVLGVLVFLFPYSPWWPEEAASTPSGSTVPAADTTPPATSTPIAASASSSVGSLPPTPTVAVVPIVDGFVDVPQTYLLDVDTGTVIEAGADLWFEAATATERFFAPWGGAELALAGSTPPGYAGCTTANYSINRIQVDFVPVGGYVCLRTGAGRISELQLVAPIGPSPGTLHLHIRTFSS